jgi:hypothetical protein
MSFTKVLGPGIGDGNQLIVGIITATAFYGDGSNLDGITSAGLGTAISQDQASPLSKIYYTNEVLSIGQTSTVTVPDSSNVAYTQYVDLAVEEGADFIVSDGDEFIPDVLGISTSGISLLSGTGGRVRADNFTNKVGTGAPNFPNGLTIGDGTFDTGFIEIQNVLDVTEDKTLAGSTSSTVTVARKSVVVADTKSLILGPNCELVINAFQI